MSVQVESVDRRTVICKFPVSVAQLAAAIEGISGYSLTDAKEIDSGSQRDPITIGVRLVFTRTNT